VAQGNLGIQNVKIGKDGLIINDGSRLNSTVQVVHQLTGVWQMGVNRGQSGLGAAGEL
jgi:hypothetical protein